MIKRFAPDDPQAAAAATCALKSALFQYNRQDWIIKSYRIVGGELELDMELVFDRSER